MVVIHEFRLASKRLLARHRNCLPLTFQQITRHEYGRLEMRRQRDGIGCPAVEYLGVLAKRHGERGVKGGLPQGNAHMRDAAIVGG